jgi:hypothetical protein
MRWSTVAVSGAVPKTVTIGGSAGAGGVVTTMLGASVSSRSGSACCQASSTSVAAGAGKWSRRAVVSGAGRVANVSEVTTPGAPPPRNTPQQVVAGLDHPPVGEDQVAASRLSQVGPYRQPRKPSPPPRVSPASVPCQKNQVGDGVAPGVRACAGAGRGAVVGTRSSDKAARAAQHIDARSR